VAPLGRRLASAGAREQGKDSPAAGSGLVRSGLEAAVRRR